MSTTTTTFEWDEQNNLSAMTLPGGSREEYVYSADGLRRQKKVNGAVTHYIWDEQNLLQEKDASLQTKVQYTTQPHGYGPLLSQRRFGATSPQSAQFNKVRFGSARFNQSKSSATPKSTFYGTDLSGNVRNLTDSSGAVTDRYVTTAFGKLVSSIGSTTNPYRFGGAVGYYQDNAQQYYVRRRYLNTNQAKWMSPDPIGFSGNDWNIYRYVGNNPGNDMDPSGLSVTCSDLKQLRNDFLNKREGSKARLDGIEKFYRSVAQYLDEGGYKWGAYHFRRFLSGEGGTSIMPKNLWLQDKSTTSMMQAIRKHLKDSINITNCANCVKDSKYCNKAGIWPTTTDLDAAVGWVFMKGSLDCIVKNNKINCILTWYIYDYYNWNKDSSVPGLPGCIFTISDNWAQELVNANRARVFDVMVRPWQENLSIGKCPHRRTTTPNTCPLSSDGNTVKYNNGAGSGRDR